MLNPHKALIQEIKQLTNEQIAAMELWEILALAIPRGEADAIAKNLFLGGKPVSPSTVRSWRNDPTADSADNSWGRGSPSDTFEQFITAVFSRLPEGAELIMKWHLLNFAEKQAIQGREHTLNAIEVNDKARALASQLVEVLCGQTREKT